jgi:membrane protease YdiL (CAAX protease family)
MVFRGVMQRLLIKMTGNLHWGIIICAFIFSLAHFNYSGFMTRFFMGIILGYIYVSSANLWNCIWFHFLNNGVAITFAWITGMGTDMSEFDMVGFYGWTQWLGLGCLFILLLYTTVRVKRHINTDFVNELREF